MNTLSHFNGVDRKIEGFEGLELAQNAIKSDDAKDGFAKILRSFQSFGNPYLQIAY